ncbi:MAG TPA: lytic transglycosylase domain-containing protein [Stellaceae bacterium]|nr:lytic transglycosylase domain-containing protein [Stellaceae bacterium]
MTGRAARDLPGQSPCRLVEQAARDNLLPAGLLTRLLWTESRFQADAVSPKGARGVAQFMPGTAGERGLADPFDPAEAIPQAARLLADLDRRFDNTGLAVAAYNAGGKRVGDWLASAKAPPTETQNFVRAVTGHSLGEWVAAGRYRLPADARSCLALAISLPSRPAGNRQAYGRSAYSNVAAVPESSPPDSQYYLGYRKAREADGAGSQYFIGYHDADAR